jgi:polysaccharide biosynthesis transport protein
MNISQLTRLIKKHLLLVSIFPVLISILIFVLTRNEKREYNANTLIYTGLASGYTLESGQNNRVDYFAVNNAFDNLINTVKSRSTLEEVGVRLLAMHLMLREPNPAVANAQTIGHLNKSIPESVRKQVVDYGSLEHTVENIYRYSQIPKNVIAEKLLNAKDEPYSVKGIMAKLTATREGTSDMVRLSYLSNDPAVVKQTLELITSVFMRRYRELKVSETGNVVAYFEEQLSNATRKLAGSEERMKAFSTNNKIINFYEQTKYVSAQDRDIDLDIQKEKTELEASKAALADLDKRLNIRQDVALKNQQINNLRDSLSILNSRLTMAEMSAEANPNEIRRLRNQIQNYEQKARTDIGNLYDLNNSKNGIPAKMLFDDWIEAFVNVDKGEARLLVLSDTKRKYDRFYGQFAPLGSTLNRLEREINVAEREYLEILHGLNQSKLREQNLLLASNLKVVDSPKFPDKPEGSKRILLVVMGFVVGLVLAIGFIIAKAYFDKSIKTPDRAEELTGLRFTGALPWFDSNNKQVAWAAIERQTLNQCVSKLKKWSNQQTQIVVVASSREGEGKSFFTKKLVRQLNQTGIRSVIKSVADFQYQPQYAFAGDFEDEGEQLNDFEEYQYVFVEIPALLQESIPTEITQKAAFTLWVCDATRTWTTADRYVLSSYQDTILTPIGLVLNRVLLDDMEAITGEFKNLKNPIKITKKAFLLATTMMALLGGLGTWFWMSKESNVVEKQEVVQEFAAEVIPTTTDTVQSQAVSVVDTAWDTPSTPVLENKKEVVEQKPVVEKQKEPVLQSPKPEKTGETLYYVLVGTFKSEAAAQNLKNEVKQGGYNVKILTPETPGDTYKLTAGVYRNYKAAQDQAESIGFIMDVKTSVFKKDN